MSKILIIEDEPEVTRYLAIFLEQEGYHVETAATLAEGKERAASGDHALILMDIVFPDGAADQVLPEIRKIHPDTPVLMVSGLAPDDDRLLRCLKAGAAGYIPKSSRVEELLVHIRRALRD